MFGNRFIASWQLNYHIAIINIIGPSHGHKLHGGEVHCGLVLSSIFTTTNSTIPPSL
jgi:hypothetical protein